jgi:hypothetical protein
VLGALGVLTNLFRGLNPRPKFNGPKGTAPVQVNANMDWSNTLQHCRHWNSGWWIAGTWGHRVYEARFGGSIQTVSITCLSTTEN